MLNRERLWVFTFCVLLWTTIWQHFKRLIIYHNIIKYYNNIIIIYYNYYYYNRSFEVVTTISVALYPIICLHIQCCPSNDENGRFGLYNVSANTIYSVKAPNRPFSSFEGQHQISQFTNNKSVIMFTIVKFKRTAF